MTRRPTLLAFLVVVAIPVALYLPALGYSFLFDDRPLLIDNPIVRSPRGLGEIFTADLDPRARQSDAPQTNYLRPLFILGAVGLRQLLGEDPRGWHAAAITLHGLLAGLAFLVLRREVKGTLTALAATLVFALHPSHVQSVAWVSGLQDLLFGVMSMGAFLAYQSSRDRPAPDAARLIGLGLAFAAALLSKEPAVGLLLYVAAEVVGWIPDAPTSAPRRKPIAELLVLSGLTFAYLAYRVTVLGGLAHRFPTAPDWPEALASIPIALLAYAKDLVWPVDLFLLHPARPVTGIMTAGALGAALALTLLLGGATALVIRRPSLKRPFAWMAVWIAPVLALWAVNPQWMVMDRYLLVPSLGLAWAIALWLPIEHTKDRARLAFWLALIVVEAGLSLAGMRSFENEDRFWSTAVRKDPGSSTAWTEWARKRAEASDLQAADEALAKAVNLDPRAQLPRLRQALLALRRGDAASAVSTLTELVERNPGYLPAWRNLVVALARAGDVPEAKRTLTDALGRFPEDPLLWTQSAILLRQEGRLDEALVSIRRARTLAPEDATLALRETQLLAEMGR